MTKPSLMATMAIAASFTAMVSAQPARTDEQSLRGLITAFAQARNAHNGQAVAAIYAEDGEWVSAAGERTVRGRKELADNFGEITAVFPAV